MVLCIVDAVLTVILARPAMYTTSSKIWPVVAAAHRGSIDLTAQGLDRVPSWSAGPATPRNGCLVVKVPVARCFNVLHNKLYEEETEQPLLAAGMLGSQRTWFAPQASLEPLGETTLQRLAARAGAVGGLCIIVSDPREATGGPAAAARTPEASFAPSPGRASAGRADTRPLAAL